MQQKEELLKKIGIESKINIEDVPDIDLYIDQVLQLFEKKFEGTKRNADEKVLTKTMVNNYAKGKLFYPIKNKKYSKDHLLLISLIYQLKGALSINDIKSTLSGLNQLITEEGFELEPFYRSFLELQDKGAAHFKENLESLMNESKKEVKREGQENEYLEKALMIASLVNVSNLYRRTAEQLIDELVKTLPADGVKKKD
ncbi:DUF1836 domain-containing protein [Bacillus massiliglaciei]|uniref:DUF1836 domain-containing protein n=1 Tax=Bacillus massiliglaciei TaxID=1816693 RepID=UPI000ADCBDD5|nr:DUF1836 domain-containing protein [Bacillus massiliglaciei]